MYLKILSLLAAVTLLAACETPAEDTGSSSGSGAATSSSSGSSAPAPAPAATTVPGSQQDFVVNVGDRVYFGFDQSNLTNESIATLKKQAAWLNKYPSVTVVIEGHCDERGTTEYNLGLGERRANAVKDYLISVGVQAGRLKTISDGKSRPAVPGSNEWAWSQNRRSVTVIKGGAAS
jgi:peptidoglycan-associated lipoprotein